MAHGIAILAAERLLVAKAKLDGKLRAAAKRVRAGARASEQAANDVRVSVASVVRPASNGELARIEAESVGGTRRDEWKRLERFRRRAKCKALVRIAEGTNELASLVHDGDRRRVHCLDVRASMDSRCDTILRHAGETSAFSDRREP